MSCSLDYDVSHPKDTPVQGHSISQDHTEYIPWHQSRIQLGIPYSSQTETFMLMIFFSISGIEYFVKNYLIDFKWLGHWNSHKFTLDHSNQLTNWNNSVWVCFETEESLNIRDTTSLTRIWPGYILIIKQMYFQISYIFCS